MPKTVNEIKETLDIEATRAVESGLITDRQSMKKWLLDLGLEVTRETKKSLSIKNPNDDEKARPIRLTGAIYEQDFRLTETSQQLTIAASERYRREAEQRNQSDIQRYAEYSAKRSTELEQQYRQHQNVYTAETERSNERDITADRPDYSSNQEAAATRHDSPIARTTTADQTATSELAAVEQLEPKTAQAAKLKKTLITSNIALISLACITLISSICLGYVSKSKYSDITEMENKVQWLKSQGASLNIQKCGTEKKWDWCVPDRPESAAVQQQYANSAGNQLNESRSTVIADYRRSTIAIEGTTAETTESTGAYTSTVNDYRAVKELHANFKREAQRSSEDRAEISADRAKSIRTDHFSKFFAEATRKFGISTSRTFERVSDEFEYRFRSEANNPQRATTFGPQRDRETDQATNRADHQENGLSREQYQGKLADLIQEVSSRL